MYGENMANMANMANVANMPHMENMPYMTSPYSYETCDYGYSYPVAPVAGVGVGCYRGGGGFALIVVLFILLIIIGATCYSRC